MADLPAKGTPGYDVFLAAIDIAIHAPLRQGTNVSHAKVYWPDIWELRRSLEKAGIDWRKTAEKVDRS